MVTTLEIIERSIYYSILRSAIKMGLTLNPMDYYPLTNETVQQFETDAKALRKYVAIFGAGNSQSKGSKVSPRIVIDSHGFYPGSIGLPKRVYEKETEGYQGYELPFETLDQYIDIRLLSGIQEDNRELHNILFHSIPRKGYIPQYPSEVEEKTGNIFIELVNFFDQPNNEYGLIEKVYQFSILDCVVKEEPLEDVGPPIIEIDLLTEQLNRILTVK